MSLIHLILTTLAVLAAANAEPQELTGCDDCFSTPKALQYGGIYHGGSQYGAYSVCSNGYIVLLTSDLDPINGYSYNPTPISQTEGSPMIAGFWSDANLACPGSTNTVRHDESCDPGLLWTIESRVQDPDFRPTSAVVVKYDAVQSYSCPASCDTNTFTVTIGIDQNSCRTYVIFDYESMGWNKATQSYNDPIVGYSNGQCQGFQASLGVDPKAYLNVCQTLKYRIDQSFAQEVRAQMNRGNLALVQQGKGPVFMQQQDKGREVAAMSGTRQEVIVQNFNEKNINAMENKLNRALQQAKK